MTPSSASRLERVNPRVQIIASDPDCLSDLAVMVAALVRRKRAAR